jgi:hypothetical protein
MRKRIMNLFMIDIAPSNIGSVMRIFSDGQATVYPSNWLMRKMRSELRVVVEALEARVAAEPSA